MTKILNKDLADLAHQLTLSPRRLRVEQLERIESLLATVDQARLYPYEFVCYHITKYRHRGSAPQASIPGKALIPDLVSMAEQLSRKANIGTGELADSFRTHQELADDWNVSTKTIRRWRSRGLMGLRVVFPDNVNRLVFTGSTISRFKKQHEDLLARGAAFRQLTRAERDRIVERARQLVEHKPLKLHAAARLIAEETGRAVETIRYTLRRFDAASKSEPLFKTDDQPRHDAWALAMWQCHERGDSLESIAHAMECGVAEVEQNLRTVKVQRWKHEPLEHIPNELFHAPDADAVILDAPEPEATPQADPKTPRDLPPYLQALYRTPLLTREQEADLFRRYNYLKYKAGKAIAQVNAKKASATEVANIESLMDRIELMRQRIIRANLRLVVSIAKRHVGYSDSFFEVVSDGNMSLMRAAEKFDFARGYKFSTYASWAVMKNYARSIPEDRYRKARWVTGQELVLESVADAGEKDVPASDRQHVQQAIEAGLDELSDREREVLRGHFGLGKSAQPVTLEQLGKKLGVTKERVRQIEQKALARLREVLSPALADAL